MNVTVSSPNELARADAGQIQTVTLFPYRAVGGAKPCLVLAGAYGYN